MEHDEDWKPFLVVPGNPDARKVLPGTVAHSVSVVEALKPEAEPVYGLPDKKKYPMPDRDHVLSAIRFFNYVDPQDEERLAKAILKRMRELNVTGVTVGEVNRFKKYYDRSTTLVHHGVKGMKWGVWNSETADRYSGVGHSKNKNHYKNNQKETSEIETKNGEKLILERKRGGALGSGLRKISPKIREESDKTYNYDLLVNDKKVGNLQMYRKSKDEMNIVWGSVKPKYRDRGYMSAAAKKGEEIAKSLGSKYMTAELVGNSPGDSIHKLANKRGYTVVGKIDDPDADAIWNGLTRVKKNL